MLKIMETLILKTRHLEDQAEELIISLDPSKAVANKIPTPLIKLWC